MTLQDVKLELLRRSIVIVEGYVTIKDASVEEQVALTMIKYDTDGLKVEATAGCPVHIYVNEALYASELNRRAHAIESYMKDRHNQNPNNCRHEVIMIDNKKSCRRCMAKFGETIMLSLGNN